MFILRYMFWLDRRILFFVWNYFFLESDQDPIPPVGQIQRLRYKTVLHFPITYLQPQAGMQDTLITYLGQKQASSQLENLSLTGIFLRTSLVFFYFLLL